MTSGQHALFDDALKGRRTCSPRSRLNGEAIHGTKPERIRPTTEMEMEGGATAYVQSTTVYREAQDSFLSRASLPRVRAQVDLYAPE